MLTKINQLLFRYVLFLFQYRHGMNLFNPLSIGDPYDLGLLNCRMLVYDLFYHAWKDIFPTGNNHVLSE